MTKPFMVTESSDGKSAELVIDGVISSDSWWGDEVTPEFVRNEIKKQANGKPLTIVINSPGGEVFAGAAIYNALRTYEGKKTVRVDGVAASMASVIAMVGDEIIMSPGSTMMVHRPSVLAWGNAKDLKDAIKMLEEIEDTILPIYEKRTGKTRDEVFTLLDETTWMSADKAVELGFADKVDENEPTAFAKIKAMLGDKQFAFNMSAMQKSLADYVKAEEEQTVDEVEEAPAEPTEPVVEPTEPEAEVTADTEPEAEDETEEEEVTEPSPEDIKQPVKEEEMADNIETAKAQVIAPEAQAPVEVKANLTDYLKSEASMKDFAQVLATNAGKSSTDVRAAWEAHLKVTMNITNPEKLLPDAVTGAIQDAFKEGGEIWQLVNKTGLKAFKVLWDTVTGENSRAKGHTRGNTKNEEVITLDDRTIRAQFIYKYLTLDKETIYENEGDPASLVTYVLTELPRRIVREVERAIILGDGRSESDENHIYSFVPVADDATAGNAFASSYTPAAGESSYEAVILANTQIKTGGAVTLVASKAWVANLKLAKSATDGHFLLPVGADVSALLGVSRIVTPDWMDESVDFDAFLIDFSAYRAVGRNNIESFANFVLKENKNEYLQEIYAGGALSDLKAAVGIVAVS